MQSAELSPVGNKRSPDKHEACVLWIPALPCPPLCGFIPQHSLLGHWRLKNIPGAQTVDVMSLLSSPVYRLNFPWISSLCRLAGLSLVVPLVPPFCDVIFVKDKKESENGGVCLNGWFSLIPWLICPLLWSQCIVVHAQILLCKVTFVWLAGSPPQRTNPAELVHSVTTSWPGGIGH